MELVILRAVVSPLYDSDAFNIRATAEPYDRVSVMGDVYIQGAAKLLLLLQLLPASPFLTPRSHHAQTECYKSHVNSGIP